MKYLNPGEMESPDKKYFHLGLVSLPGLKWITGLAVAKGGAIHFQMKKAGIFGLLIKTRKWFKHIAHQSNDSTDSVRFYTSKS